MTSHPERAPSAADLEKALAGIDFPKSKRELVEAARDADQAVLQILQGLPEKEYRDSAEVARALGEIRSHQDKPDYQPSKKGGAEAMKSVSAAKITSLFAGIRFPASDKDLKRYARDKAGEAEMAVIEKFHHKTYRDMSDVAKEMGRVT
jgi:hypothetical protein